MWLNSEEIPFECKKLKLCHIKCNKKEYINKNQRGRAAATAVNDEPVSIALYLPIFYFGLLKWFWCGVVWCAVLYCTVSRYVYSWLQILMGIRELHTEVNFSCEFGDSFAQIYWFKPAYNSHSQHDKFALKWYIYTHSIHTHVVCIYRYSRIWQFDSV